MTSSAATTKPRCSIEELNRLLRYDPETGQLFWRVVSGRTNSYAGRPAFTAVSDDGRRIGMIMGRMYKAHVVCFALHHGRWPEEGMQVDHANRDPSDNRAVNLREAAHWQNNANRTKKPGTKSRFHGVTRCSRSGLWKGQVSKDNRNHSTRRVSSEEEAARLRDELALKLHGEFAHLNFGGGYAEQV